MENHPFTSMIFNGLMEMFQWIDGKNSKYRGGSSRFSLEPMLG
jgi:hypothetical protein